ncbi:MAG: right-handed parallel beta-helix repeat-containing protein [Deltaproteobacteria bacterium]|nr:right-handed parallel beta-helix repeat-containing protein [Deltaproteobacteria bacterium]
MRAREPRRPRRDAGRPTRAPLALLLLGLAACAEGTGGTPDATPDGGGPDADAPDAPLPEAADGSDSVLPDADVPDAVLPDADVFAEAEAEAGVDADAADTVPDVPAGCPELAALRDTPSDSSAALQACIDRTPEGGTLELEPGRYSLAAQLRLDRAITLGTRGRAGTAACTADAAHGCAELFLLPAFDARFGAFFATAAVTIDHLVLHGNRQNRGGTHAHDQCSTLTDNAYGFNGTFQCSGCTFRDGVSMYALCGTGFLVTGSATGVAIQRSTFAYNGLHTTRNMWADGLTVHDASDSDFSHNAFIDNTDIDLIFGGCRSCTIRNNTVTHTADAAGGSFAAIMIHKWPTTSGCYEDVDVSGNAVDCGPLRACGSGLYIASEGWYPETPYGTLVDGTTSGLITGNTVVNAMNALYIAARGLAIYGNGFLNAHGMSIPNSCHRSIVSVTPIVVSPTAASCHFNYENIDPVMSVHYSSASWAGCVPNYPF